MTPRPHNASPAATGVDLILVAVTLGALGYAAVVAVRIARRGRRWPKPRKSWTRNFYADRDRKGQP